MPPLKQSYWQKRIQCIFYELKLRNDNEIYTVTRTRCGLTGAYDKPCNLSEACITSWSVTDWFSILIALDKRKIATKSYQRIIEISLYCD